jgi:hypothetical protein
MKHKNIIFFVVLKNALNKQVSVDVVAGSSCDREFLFHISMNNEIFSYIHIYHPI